jgi:hypothetical protein
MPPPPPASLRRRATRFPRQTLLDWKVAHAECFRQISTKHTQEIREVIAQEQIEIAHAAGEAEREAIAKARGQLKDGSIRDASTAARNFSVTKGIALDHALKQRGEPTVIHEHNVQAEDVFKRLQALAPQVFVIEGQAEEVPRSRKLPEIVASNGHVPEEEDHSA